MFENKFFLFGFQIVISIILLLIGSFFLANGLFRWKKAWHLEKIKELMMSVVWIMVSAIGIFGFLQFANNAFYSVEITLENPIVSAFSKITCMVLTLFFSAYTMSKGVLFWKNAWKSLEIQELMKSIMWISISIIAIFIYINKFFYFLYLV